MNNFQEKVSFIWEIADLLRGPVKRSDYQKVILPFVVLKRFDSVLENTKGEVVKKYESFKNEIENIDHLLRTSTNGLSFYNFSKYDFKKLLEDPEHIEENLYHYLDSFSQNVQDIFEHFKIKSWVDRLAKSQLLFKLVKKFNDTKINLHPDVVSNYEMGLIFEELVRKFSEQSNEEAWDHFTPRDIVHLMTGLMLKEDEEELKTKSHIIKKIYDPTCGTGGMLTSSKEYIHQQINPNTKVVLYWQEINDETYAIAKWDMLIKGEKSNNIQWPSSTLWDDRFKGEQFDYIISNPPYGVDWKSDEEFVKKESELWFDGRFGAWTPRINDGQLLFLQHMISKMKTNGEKSKIVVITNGSPLFTWDAGSWESEIRKWIIENDYLECIIGLPTQLFYNTGISTYIWIMSNQKKKNRIGKIQLIDGTHLRTKMRKSLGNKRHYLTDEQQKEIINLYHNFEENEFSKIFPKEEFGYTKVQIERPMRFIYKINDETLDNLYSYSGFSKFSQSKSKDLEIKEKEEEEWRNLQQKIINSLKTIGNDTFTNWKVFEGKVKDVLEEYKLSPSFIKNIILCLSENSEEGEYVLDGKGKKQYDSNLRDYEKIKLGEDIEEYFDKEVKKYYDDSWMDRKKDKIGYELNFTKYFYTYESPKDVEGIDEDILKITKEINELLES